MGQHPCLLPWPHDTVLTLTLSVSSCSCHLSACPSSGKKLGDCLPSSPPHQSAPPTLPLHSFLFSLKPFTSPLPPASAACFLFLPRWDERVEAKADSDVTC